MVLICFYWGFNKVLIGSIWAVSFLGWVSAALEPLGLAPDYDQGFRFHMLSHPTQSIRQRGNPVNNGLFIIIYFIKLF